MKAKTSRRLFDQSYAWIRNHWDAQNLDVPDEFVAQWIYTHDDENPAPVGFHLAVFSFGYLQHVIVSNNVPPGKTLSVGVTELLDLFQKWQIKLALAEVHRRTDVRTKPLPLFAFRNDEQVETWAEGRSPSRPCGEPEAVQ